MISIIIIIFIIICILILLFFLFFYNRNKMYQLTIMAIFKNEQNYMNEWLQHHINQGFDHFYLYCNDENINKYDYLNKYKKYITLIQWTDKVNDGNNTIQRQAYTHCVKNYNNEYKYIMMLDLDEFVINNNNNSKVIDFINILDNNTKAIKIPRFDFNSNGHVNKPNGNVMDNYKESEKICSSYKTIANSDFIDISKNFYGVHDFNFLEKNGKIYNDYFSYKYTGYPNKCNKNDINETPLIINHYYTKSYEEYMERCKLWENGGVNNINYRKNCSNLFFIKENEISNNKI